MKKKTCRECIHCFEEDGGSFICMNQDQLDLSEITLSEEDYKNYIKNKNSIEWEDYNPWRYYNYDICYLFEEEKL